MMYPKSQGRSKTPTNGKKNGKGEDSELLALDQLLGELDKEIDKKHQTEKKRKASPEKIEKKMAKSSKKDDRSKTLTTAAKVPEKVFGRDRKLRDHTKLKIFSEIEKKLFDTRIDNVKLGQFLKVKQHEKADLVKYEWARDTNVMNLRFFSYLMMEEIETIIDNMDETRGMNYLNSVDAKLQKRNNIINHLLREKAVTAKLMTKILAIMENTSTDSQDLTHMITSLDLPKSAPKSRILSKLQNIQEDMNAMQQIRNFSKGYYTEIDFQNLVAAQKNLSDPLSQDNFNQLKEIKTVFEKVNRHAQIAEEYKKLQDDMIKREQNYNELVGRYEQLIGDFMRYIGDKNLQSIGLDDSNTGYGGFTAEELARIKAKYDKMREEDEVRFRMQFQSKGYTMKHFDEAGLNQKPETETVKKITRKKKSRSPRRQSGSPSSNLRSKSPHLHNFDSVKKKTSTKKVIHRDKDLNNRRKKKPTPKRAAFDFSDEYDNDAFRNDSPPIDVELSRISRNQQGGRIPEFGYSQPQQHLSSAKDTMKYSEYSPSPQGYKQYQNPQEVKLFSPHSPYQNNLPTVMEQPQNSQLSNPSSNKNSGLQGQMANQASNAASSRNSQIAQSKAPSLVMPNTNIPRPLDAAQHPNMPLPPPNIAKDDMKLRPPDVMKLQPPAPPISAPGIAPPPIKLTNPPTIPPPILPPISSALAPPPPPAKNPNSQPPKPPQQPSLNQSVAVNEEKGEKDKGKDSFAYSGKADTKKDDGFSDYLGGGVTEKSKEISPKSSKKDDTLGYLDNDSFGFEKSSKRGGGDTLDYLGGGGLGPSKSKDSLLDLSRRSSIKGTINAYADESSDYL